MNDRNLYAAADALRDLLIQTHDRGIRIVLNEETGAVGINPPGSLTETERHTLRLHLPELVALLRGFMWDRRIARLTARYRLTNGRSWLCVSKEATAALLDRFEAKHGPLSLDLADELHKSLEVASPEYLIKTGRDVAHDLVKRLEQERADQSARVRSGMTRLLGIHERGFERHMATDLDTTDPALLAMLADLEPPASF
ncbi:MAG: hypothetical protein FNT29_10340 [Halothiobacillaceae bacterium]|nr:MAG: hypothetical protein FNT29_10340 [Halothiobacillaceae bacterium]